MTDEFKWAREELEFCEILIEGGEHLKFEVDRDAAASKVPPPRVGR